MEKLAVYLVKGRRVITLAKCGDNFGSVLDIDNNETFTTYGFNTINFNSKTAIGSIERHTVYKNFKQKD